MAATWRARTRQAVPTAPMSAAVTWTPASASGSDRMTTESEARGRKVARFDFSRRRKWSRFALSAVIGATAKRREAAHRKDAGGRREAVNPPGDAGGRT